MRAPLPWLLLASLTLGASAAVLRVPQDLPGIQAAFDASAAGDTVLVDRGTWAGLYTGPAHSVTLCSNHLFTGDTTDIVETVLDGEYAGTILDVHSGPDTWFTLHGLTLQRGQGQVVNAYIYCDRAGALHVTDSTNVRIEHVVFRDNRAPRRAAILHVVRQCAGLGTRSHVVMRQVHCVNNRHDTIGENHLGAMSIKLSNGSIDLRGIRFVDAPDSGRHINAHVSRSDSVIFDDIKMINCMGDLRLESSLANGESRYTNIAIENQEGARGCLLSLTGSFSNPDSSVLAVHNIRIQGGVYLRRVPFGGFTYSSVSLDLDSLTVSQVRRLSTPNAGRLVQLQPYGHSTLRNLHMHHNVTGDSTQCVGGSLLNIWNMDLLGAHIHDNRVILPPHPDPSGSGGNYVVGAMVYAWGGDRRFEDLVFENNRVEDLDNVGNPVPGEAYHRNHGRELYAGGSSIQARNIHVRNSQAPNPCPEVYSPADIDLSGPGSTLAFIADKVRLEDTVLSDCDDGGIVLSGDSLLAQNVVLRNVGRTAFHVGGNWWPDAPVSVRLRNVHIENVDARWTS
jgi:hypothetical protein